MAFFTVFLVETVFDADFTGAFLVETAFLTGFLLVFCVEAAFTAVFFLTGDFFEAVETVFLDDDGFFTVLEVVFAAVFFFGEVAAIRTGFARVFDEVFGAFFAAGLAVFLVIFPPKLKLDVSLNYITFFYIWLLFFDFFERFAMRTMRDEKKGRILTTEYTEFHGGLKY